MPLFLVGASGLFVAALVIANHLAHMAGLGRAAATAEQHHAALVQRPAHLLPSHLRVFPPAAARCGPTRTPSRSGPGSDGAPGPRTAAPRSASAPPPACPGGSRARPWRGRTPPPAPAPAAGRSRC